MKILLMTLLRSTLVDKSQLSLYSPSHWFSPFFILMSLRGKLHDADTVWYTLLILHISRLQLEVDEVLGDSNYVSADDLEKLEYTEQVCTMYV